MVDQAHGSLQSVRRLPRHRAASLCAYGCQVRLRVVTFMFLAFGLVVSACSDDSNEAEGSPPPVDVRLQVRADAPSWLAESNFFFLEEPTSYDLLGVTDWEGGERVILSYETTDAPECFAVVDESGWSATCAETSAFGSRSVILWADFGGSHEFEFGRLLVRTDPRVTEIQVTTGDGTVYAVEPLGSVGYIEWRDVANLWTLELYDGSTLMHRES